MDDRILIRNCKNGSTDYFNILINKYKSPLYTFCFHLCKNKHDADDLFQETWIKVFNNINKYKFEYSFSTWIFSIAHNLFRDKVRKLKRRGQTIDVDDINNVVHILKINENPEKEALKNEEQQLLERCLLKIDEKYRTPIILFYIKGLPQKDIAIILNININTLKSRIRLGLEKLRFEMDGDNLG